MTLLQDLLQHLDAPAARYADLDRYYTGTQPLAYLSPEAKIALGNRFGLMASNVPRLAVTAQYCDPWLRPQEAFTLSMTRDTVRRVSEDIRRMLGYSIPPPFIGQVDGMHPKRLLERS